MGGDAVESMPDNCSDRYAFARVLVGSGDVEIGWRSCYSCLYGIVTSRCAGCETRCVCACACCYRLHRRFSVDMSLWCCWHCRAWVLLSGLLLLVAACYLLSLCIVATCCCFLLSLPTVANDLLLLTVFAVCYRCVVSLLAVATCCCCLHLLIAIAV